MSAQGEYRLEIIEPDGSIDRLFSNPSTIDLTGLHHIGSIRGSDAYASSGLKAEMEALQEADSLPPDTVYHCTSSRALPRISEQKAILCSREALRIYGSLETGEIAHMYTGEWPQRGLDDVYAHYMAGTSYFFGGSGGDHAVIFGIHGMPIKDAYGDGLTLGPVVGLDAVVSVAVPHEHLPATKEWVAENCRPETLTMSLYAASLLTTLTPN